jgi:UDPglucose 6-dehydrogenase
MKLSVIGIGYVGLVAAACLAEGGNHVICVDKDADKIDRLNNGHIPIYEPGLTEIVARNVEAKRLTFTTDIAEGVVNSLITIIGVGTPSAPDGSADMSAVYAVCEEIAKAMSDYHIIVTKSTVPIGTHKKVAEIVNANTSHPFDYVSNPEFLKEGSAVDDFMKPDRVIVGTDNHAVREIMKQLYSPFMRKSSRMIFMDPASAEMSKYAANAMLATRITFMNELTALCEEFGADIEYVRHGVGSDSRIGNSFLFAGLGYGGSCFPKDVRALAFMGDEQGVDMTIIKTVQQANYRQQDRFARRIIDYYKDTPGAVLGVWGLAFKAKTDDVRESPAIRCIRQFVDAGLRIRAFDPEAMENAKGELGGDVDMCGNEYDVIAQADGLVIMTDWQEFRSPDFERFKKEMNRPTIFDGRNLYDPEYVRNQGIEYYGVGRG